MSTGDELVDISQTPDPYHIRSSNHYMFRAALKEYGIEAVISHLPDNPEIIYSTLEKMIPAYDVIILSGGVSMGKFDFIPAMLEKLEVRKLFHKVQQRPGKPFWFGAHQSGTVVFAFPGNPVSGFMCLYRYFLPWLRKCWQLDMVKQQAVLAEDFIFKPALQYFLLVKLETETMGTWVARPLQGNGSGDFANLLDTDAFLELPLQRNEFKKGERFPVWPFRKQI
jgi:molybdopterin molybdotransferase